ncbi:Retrovirus-related Pol polyprotein from type-1 retrotransposable element R1 4 [Amphibalanus amphitrite]|uniref:Retrovirus-related Pol polyprotein from type-1 retrotransposable element R1 4 n=1 Tax=Amphibalanus amphitrite TaxID=1232801 RepID=A0A6A4VDZ2_AMPAM|nr:Retrovirus-related Pol polyprotein from type-1 retrotransposable element R1 4 [Amphibalanus amphitrite]
MSCLMAVRRALMGLDMMEAFDVCIVDGWCQADQVRRNERNCRAAWDPLVEEDAIGEQVQEWISQRDFVVANSGAPTRQSPAPPYALSTPDITLHHSSLTNRVEWETLTALPSDHFPILVKVRVGKRKKEEKRKTKPSFKKADWALFEKIIEEKLAASPEWDEHTPLKAATYQFNDLVITAAARAIPCGARRDPVPWWTEEVDEAVRRRDELRAQAKADPAAGAAWREAAKEASLTITKARQESWRTFASGLSLRSDVGQVCDRDVSAAETKVQRALDSLEEWARRWKMVVSLEKTTSTIFTLDPAEARREAALHFQGQPVKFSPTTTFLGITLDRSLTFTGHVKTIKAKMLQRNNVLRAISGTTWGCSPSDLRSTYLAFSRACADYAAGAWMPGLSESGLRELETVQRQACRTITGCVRSTPVDALAREADLLPFSARRRQLAAVAMERHSRDLPGDPVQRILLPENRPRQRLRYDRGWARTGQEISKDAGLDDLPREPFLVVASTPPWESPPPPTVLFHTGLERPLPQNAPAEQRRTAAEETLAGLPNPDVQAFTDGSATAGTGRGGAGAVVYRSGREVKRIRAPAGRFTSSYTAELLALRETLKYIESILTDQDPALNIQLCTDSLSSLMRLREGPANQTER